MIARWSVSVTLDYGGIYLDATSLDRLDLVSFSLLLILLLSFDQVIRLNIVHVLQDLNALLSNAGALRFSCIDCIKVFRRKVFLWLNSFPSPDLKSGWYLDVG